MRRRKYIRIVAFVSLLIIPAAKCLLAATEITEKAPNIILIMADDLGHETLGSYGGVSYSTPNLDKLARGGIRFKNCHSTPVCSPSRVTILTGRYTFRTTMRWGHIPRDEVTFGSMLADAGYKTALAGKWQLARLKDDPKHVKKRGFKESRVWGWGEGPRYWNPIIYRNRKVMKNISDRYGPDIFTEFLLNFIKANKDKRFLAYYPMCLPHFPLKDEPKGPNGKWETYKEMVEIMDKKVGQIVSALDDLGLRQKTLILFTADNGSPERVTSLKGNRIIKGGKGELTDAGTHVPLIANWPGSIPANTTSEDLIDFSDFMPTLAELAGAKLPDVRIDGISFAPQLKGKTGNPREWIYNEYRDKSWIRTKQWKLYRDGRFYNMKNDPLEKTPIEQSASSSQIRNNLQKILNNIKEP